MEFLSPRCNFIINTNRFIVLMKNSMDQKPADLGLHCFQSMVLNLTFKKLHA